MKISLVDHLVTGSAVLIDRISISHRVILCPIQFRCPSLLPPTNTSYLAENFSIIYPLVQWCYIARKASGSDLIENRAQPYDYAYLHDCRACYITACCNCAFCGFYTEGCGFNALLFLFQKVQEKQRNDLLADAAASESETESESEMTWQREVNQYLV